MEGLPPVWLRRGDDGGGEWQASQRKNERCVWSETDEAPKSFSSLAAASSSSVVVGHVGATIQIEFAKFHFRTLCPKISQPNVARQKLLSPRFVLGLSSPSTLTEPRMVTLRQGDSCCRCFCYNIKRALTALHCGGGHGRVWSGNRSIRSDVTIFPHSLLIICVSNSKLHQQHPHQEERVGAPGAPVKVKLFTMMPRVGEIDMQKDI